MQGGFEIGTEEAESEERGEGRGGGGGGALRDSGSARIWMASDGHLSSMQTDIGDVIPKWINWVVVW